MGSAPWGQAAARQAGYEQLPQHEPPALAPALGPQHTAVPIPADREQAIACALLAFAHQEAHHVCAALGTSVQGLPEGEAARRLRQHGPNVVSTTGVPPWYR